MTDFLDLQPLELSEPLFCQYQRELIRALAEAFGGKPPQLPDVLSPLYQAELYLGPGFKITWSETLRPESQHNLDRC